MKNLIFLVVLTTLVFSSCKDSNEPEMHNSINAKLFDIVEPSGDSPHAYFHIYNEYEQYFHTDTKEEHQKTMIGVFACDSNWNSYRSKHVTINGSTIPWSVIHFSRDFNNEYVNQFDINIEHKGKEYNWLVNNLPNLKFDIEQGKVITVNRNKPFIIKYSNNSGAYNNLRFVNMLVEQGHWSYYIQKENIEANGEIVIPTESFAGADDNTLISLEIYRADLNENIPNTKIQTQHKQIIKFNVNVK